jgi:hypothetical protein
MVSLALATLGLVTHDDTRPTWLASCPADQ